MCVCSSRHNGSLYIKSLVSIPWSVSPMTSSATAIVLALREMHEIPTNSNKSHRLTCTCHRMHPHQGTHDKSSLASALQLSGLPSTADMMQHTVYSNNRTAMAGNTWTIEERFTLIYKRRFSHRGAFCPFPRQLNIFIVKVLLIEYTLCGWLQWLSR